VDYCRQVRISMEKEINKNDRVRWYEYSADMVIIRTGLGIVISVEIWEMLPHLMIANILCDNGNLQRFSIEDIELFEEW